MIGDEEVFDADFEDEFTDVPDIGIGGDRSFVKCLKMAVVGWHGVATSEKVAFAGPGGTAIATGQQSMAVALTMGHKTASGPRSGGHAIAGCWGIALVEAGFAVAGDNGFAVARGHDSCAQVGERGISIVGNGGRAMGRIGARLIFIEIDCILSAVVGTDGIQPEQWYEVKNRSIVEAERPAEDRKSRF